VTANIITLKSINSLINDCKNSINQFDEPKYKQDHTIS
jgi:hypothetical protein